MQRDEARYVFATDLMWWAFEVFYRLLGDIEQEELQIRVEEFESEFDDIGWWLLHAEEEVSIVIDGKRTSAKSLGRAAQEQTAAEWVRAIGDLSESVVLEERPRLYFLLYLSCRWVSAALNGLEAELADLGGEWLARYGHIAPLCAKLRSWLEEQSADCRAHIPEDQLEAVEARAATVDTVLAVQWRRAVAALADEYT